MQGGGVMAAMWDLAFEEDDVACGETGPRDQVGVGEHGVPSSVSVVPYSEAA